MICCMQRQEEEGGVEEAHRFSNLGGKEGDSVISNTRGRLGFGWHEKFWSCQLMNAFTLLQFCVYMCVAAQSLSCVPLSVTPWAIAHQTPLFMVLFQQEYWSALPFSPSGYLLYPRIEPTPPEAPALAGEFTTEPPGKPCV